MEVRSLKNASRTDKWRICLYSKPGVGKTSAVKYLQGKTLILDLDNSTKVLAGLDVDIVSFDRTHPEGEINEFVKQAPQLIKGYDNLVIDNISSFEKDWFTSMGKQSKNGISNEIQDYSKWTNYFNRLITSLYALPANILITAWENSKTINNENNQTLNLYAPEIRDSVRDTFMGVTDIVGRMIINPKTSNRGVILEGNDAIFAKNRLDNRTVAPIEELFNFKTQNQKEQSDNQEKEGTK